MSANDFTFLCSEDCDIEAVPTISSAVCDDQTQKAGVQYIGWTSCNLRFAARGSGLTVDVKNPAGGTTVVGEITDPAVWTTLKTDGLVSLSPILLADLPVPTPNLVKRKSCQPEEVVSWTYTLNSAWDQADCDVVDGNASETDEYAYNLSSNISKFGFFFIGCDGTFYFNDRDNVPWFNFSGSPAKVIPEDGVTEVTRYEFVPTWTYPFGTLQTLFLPSVLTALLT